MSLRMVRLDGQRSRVYPFALPTLPGAGAIEKPAGKHNRCWTSVAADPLPVVHSTHRNGTSDPAATLWPDVPREDGDIQKRTRAACSAGFGLRSLAEPGGVQRASPDYLFPTGMGEPCSTG